MTLLLDEVAAYLTALGIATPEWALRISYFSDDQDQVIGLFETGGFPPAELNRENERLTFQARIRAGRLDYLVCRAKWLEVFNALQDAQQVDGSPILLPGIVYVQAMQYGPLVMSDDKGRPNLMTNFRVMRKRT